MPKVMAPQKTLLPPSTATPTATTPSPDDHSPSGTPGTVDFDDFTTSSSILEFLSKERECSVEPDLESIFQEVGRLADNSDTRSVDELMREAELLMRQQTLVAKTTGDSKGRKIETKTSQQSIKLNPKYTTCIQNQPPCTTALLNGHCRSSSSAGECQASEMLLTPFTPTPQTPCGQFSAFVDNLPSVSVISQESTPKDFQNCMASEKDAIAVQLSDSADDGTDTEKFINHLSLSNYSKDEDQLSWDIDELNHSTPLNDEDSQCLSLKMEEITEAMETIELRMQEDELPCTSSQSRTLLAYNTNPNEANTDCNSNNSNITLSPAREYKKFESSFGKRTNFDFRLHRKLNSQQMQQQLLSLQSPRRLPSQVNSPCSSERSQLSGSRQSSMTASDSGISLHRSLYTPPRQQNSPRKPSHLVTQSYCEEPQQEQQSSNSSPNHMVSSATSPIEPPNGNASREYVLKLKMSSLQEQLKDTEERLQALRLQHDSLSQAHRDLRESNARLQDESDMLKLDVQNLSEVADVLRLELQSARRDREEALDLQKKLQEELYDGRQEQKREREHKERDAKTIQDLQRQCKEMERILMRKYPDSVSALIVAAKNRGCMSSNDDRENVSSRRLLEQRIAQLEADAKEQDEKAQGILANVQARFHSVQSKYETHIADLETQVLSLQEINAKLNEKLEKQTRTLDFLETQKAENYFDNATQTEEVSEAKQNGRTSPSVTLTTSTQTLAPKTINHGTNTIGIRNLQVSASSSASSTANTTPSNSRPSSKQSGLRNPMCSSTSKLPMSHSDSTIAQTAKADAHLLANIRSLRVDLTLSEKSVSRLTRELEECKKTIRKLEKEKSALRAIKMQSTSTTSLMRRSSATAQTSDHALATTESQAVKEAQSKVKLLEADYKSLHDKRLQDLKILQTAHEREISSCHETIRILEGQLSEREEVLAAQKRRKVPVDYYALKTKV